MRHGINGMEISYSNLSYNTLVCTHLLQLWWVGLPWQLVQVGLTSCNQGAAQVDPDTTVIFLKKEKDTNIIQPKPTDPSQVYIHL